ncbi:MAG: DUF6029 family protein, partial [Paludibacteraceae bacterium]
MRVLPMRFSTYLFALVGLLVLPMVAHAQKDTVYVTGGLQHESLFPTVNVDADRNTPKADWAKIDHLSNTYLDLGVRYEHNGDNKAGFQGVEVMLRGELTKWPLLGYDADFGGYGLSHLHVALPFKWGRITVGDVYGQFGSGFVLRLYEDRPLGIDNALRGGKIEFTPYKGIYATLIGGKQRRYWNCYTDGAGGWNYTQDATIGGDIELGIHEWSQAMQDAGANLTIGGSYVSKYQRMDTIITAFDNQLYMYNLPEWVGAGDVRALLQMKGWNALIEYAYKANDPTIVNTYSYKHGEALLLSLYSWGESVSSFPRSLEMFTVYRPLCRLRNSLTHAWVYSSFADSSSLEKREANPISACSVPEIAVTASTSSPFTAWKTHLLTLPSIPCASAGVKSSPIKRMMFL